MLHNKQETEKVQVLKEVLNEFTLMYLLESPANVLEFGKDFFAIGRPKTEIVYMLDKPSASESSSTSSFDAKLLAKTRPGQSKKLEDKKVLELYIKQSPILNTLDSRNLKRVLNAMFRKEVSPGEVLLKQGDEGSYFYLIESGLYESYIKDVDGNEQLIKYYENCGSFGARVILNDSRQKTSVKAVVSGTLWCLDRKSFKKFIMVADNPKLRLYESYLSNIPIFSPMNQNEIATLAKALRPMIFSNDRVIVKQGQTEDGIHIVEKGVVKLIFEQDGNRKTKMLKAGDWFGELAMISYLPSNATVVCVGDVRTVYIGVDEFERLFGNCLEIVKRKEFLYNKIFRQIFHKNRALARLPEEEAEEESDDDLDEEECAKIRKNMIRSREVVAESINPEREPSKLVLPEHQKTPEQIEDLKRCLQKCVLFSSLDDNQMHSVLSAMYERTVKAGDVIIKQGDNGDHFYVIDEGFYEAIFKDKDGIDKIIKIYNNSGSFGELALMYNTPRAATVTAKTNGRLWVMDRLTFRQIMVCAAYFKRKLFNNIMDEIKMFGPLTAEERDCIADVLAPISFQDGEVILEEGEDGEGMFFIERGCVKITNDHGVSTMLEDGDYFGELALITKEQRAATCVAVGEVKAAYLHGEAFERTLGPCLEIMKRRTQLYNEARSKIEEINRQATGERKSRSSRVERKSIKKVTLRGDDHDDTPPFYTRARGTVVYSEIYDPRKETDFEPPKYEKTKEQMTTLKSCVRDCVLLGILNRDQLEQVFNAMFYVPVKANTYVIKQGEDGDNFYIIESGVFEATITEGDKQVFKKVYKNKGSFGELALMYNQPRAASVMALSEGKLWALDRCTFRHIVLSANFRKKRLYEHFLDTVPVLDPLTGVEKSKLSDALKPKYFLAGDVIIREGDKADGMYFIEKGNVNIIIKNKTVGTLEQGEYFGELALLTKNPRAATIVAKEDVTVAFLEMDSFERILGPYMDIMRRKIDSYERSDLCTMQFNEKDNTTEPFPKYPKSNNEQDNLSLKLKKLVFFQSINELMFQTVVDAFMPAHIKAGETVIEQGTNGQFLYVINTGKFEVSIVDEQGFKSIKRTYENIGMFGELALMFQKPRAASVVALTEGDVWVLDELSFRRVLFSGAYKKWQNFQHSINGNALITNLNETERILLVDLFLSQTMAVRSGEAVYKIDDEVSGLYRVESGEVMFKCKEGVKELKPALDGDYFGEKEMMDKTNRVMTAIASRETIVSFIPKGDFERMFGPSEVIANRRKGMMFS